MAEGDENYFCAVCFHRVGDPQAIDRLVFDMPDRKEVVFDVEVAHGDRWVVITAFEGSSEKSETYLIDRRFETAACPIFSGFTDSSTFVGAAAGPAVFRTEAPRPWGASSRSIRRRRRRSRKSSPSSPTSCLRR